MKKRLQRAGVPQAVLNLVDPIVQTCAECTQMPAPQTVAYKGIDPHYREEQRLPMGGELQLLLEQGASPCCTMAPLTL